MLFNSYQFLFLFLPVALLGYSISNRIAGHAPTLWLTACSLFFYGYWDYRLLGMLIVSIAVNYTIGSALGRTISRTRKSRIFFFGVFLNIALLFGFKYAAPLMNFAIAQHLVNASNRFDIILPLGISFFTFTQVGYLVDRRDGLAEDLGPLRYTLFVTFFPHLIAGPILHIREIGSQLVRSETFGIRNEQFMPSFTLFALGMAKKVLLADPLSVIVAAGYADPTHAAALTAWKTTVTYMAQLYFDFSGYSDMAIGLAGMFGIRFPNNFNSPYRAQNIIDFWQRWHITLSRYIGLLLYNPVALAVARWRIARGLRTSKKALARPSGFLAMVALPTYFAMGLAGIWHGAGLQFLIFGLLHASYLTINHAWRVWGPAKRLKGQRRSLLAAFSSLAITQSAVLVAFVFFRSGSYATAVSLLSAMVGAHGWALPLELTSGQTRLPYAIDAVRIMISFGIIFLMPNSMEILGNAAPILEPLPSRGPAWAAWRPSAAWGFATATLIVASALNFTSSTEFLYFQF